MRRKVLRSQVLSRGQELFRATARIRQRSRRRKVLRHGRKLRRARGSAPCAKTRVAIPGVARRHASARGHVLRAHGGKAPRGGVALGGGVAQAPRLRAGHKCCDPRKRTPCHPVRFRGVCGRRAADAPETFLERRSLRPHAAERALCGRNVPRAVMLPPRRRTVVPACTGRRRW